MPHGFKAGGSSPHTPTPLGEGGPPLSVPWTRPKGSDLSAEAVKLTHAGGSAVLFSLIGLTLLVDHPRSSNLQPVYSTYNLFV